MTLEIVHYPAFIASFLSYKWMLPKYLQLVSGTVIIQVNILCLFPVLHHVHRFKISNKGDVLDIKYLLFWTNKSTLPVVNVPRNIKVYVRPKWSYHWSCLAKVNQSIQIWFKLNWSIKGNGTILIDLQVQRKILASIKSKRTKSVCLFLYSNISNRYLRTDRSGFT